MAVRSIVLSCLMLLAISGCANKGPPPVSDRQAALSGAIQVINTWQQSADFSQPRDLSPLYTQAAILKNSGSSGNNDRLGTAALFYLGEIEFAITAAEKRANGKIDRALGQEALTNLDIVLARNEDIPEWRVTVAEANYAAGGTVSALDGPTELAQRYWNACAKLGHPGCVNNVASILLDKPAPSDDNIRNALDLHAQVVATGTRALCAGQFSAETMAKLMHFTGIRRPGDDEVKLLDAAQAFYRQLQESSHAKDPCDGGRIGVDQYMMQLDRGEQHESLLDEVQRISDSEPWRLIAGYLQGKVSETQFAGKIASTKTGWACQLHFYAAWKATQNSERQIAQAHYQALLKLPADSDCQFETLLMRRYLNMPAASG